MVNNTLSLDVLLIGRSHHAHSKYRSCTPTVRLPIHYHESESLGRAESILRLNPITAVVLAMDSQALSAFDFIHNATTHCPDIQFCLITETPPESVLLRNIRVAGIFHPSDEEARPEDIIEAFFNSKEQLESMKGNIDAVPLRDVVQMQCHQRANGHLKVNTSGGTGRIEIVRGQLRYAAFNGTFGMEALVSMLSLEQGEFIMTPLQDVHAPNLEDQWESLMMNAALIQDERSQVAK